MSRLGQMLMVLAATLATRDAGAFELKHAENGQPVRWVEPAVTFVVDPSVEAAVPGGADAVARALTAWSGVSGGPVITVKSGAAGGRAALDGQNTVLVAPDGYGDSDALAVTVIHYDEVTGEILDADIVVNGSHPFAVLAANALAGAGSAVPVEGHSREEEGEAPFDLWHVVSHETGHALGLGDVQADDAVMYAYTAPGDASYRAPAADDLAGLAVAYAIPTGHPSCGKATVAGAGLGAGGGWAALAVLVGGLARRVVRRPRTSPPAVLKPALT